MAAAIGGAGGGSPASLEAYPGKGAAAMMQASAVRMTRVLFMGARLTVAEAPVEA